MTAAATPRGLPAESVGTCAKAGLGFGVPFDPAPKNLAEWDAAGENLERSRRIYAIIT
jgi:hypothetical protein